MTKTSLWTLEPAARKRDAAARVLRLTGVALMRLALRLRATGRTEAPAELQFEFHAEAGAPEGALYVDGRRIGVLHGVTRL